MATFFWWTFFFHHLLVCFSVPFLLFFPPLYYLYTDPVLVLLLLWLLLLLLILSWDEFFLDQLLVGLWGRVQGGFLCKQYSLWLLGNFLMAPVYVVEWILLKLFFPLEGDQQLHDCCLPRAPLLMPCLLADDFQQRPSICMFPCSPHSASPLCQTWS